MDFDNMDVDEVGPRVTVREVICPAWVYALQG